MRTEHGWKRMQLEGRRAIVTGGASGVGLAVGQRFAAEGAAYITGHTLNVDGGFNATGMLLELSCKEYGSK